MKRRLYTSDHESFREVVREFTQREVENKLSEWDDRRLIDREVWAAAGKHGIIGLSTPEEYGGVDQGDFRFRNVVFEELARVFATSLSLSFSLQDDIVVPYIVDTGTEEQKVRWLPQLAAGASIGAIAMTEPGTGSDLRGIRTSGSRVDGGWIVNGAKTFITSGINADVIVTVVRTDPNGGSRGFSLLVIESDATGFTRGRKLHKVGMPAQDTAELFFDEVFVPDANVLGEVGGAMVVLAEHLARERLSIGAFGLAIADAIFASTLEYINGRKAFGNPVADFQHSRFELAEMATELDVARAYIDQVILAFNLGECTPADAAKAKLWGSEVVHRVVDRCLQLHGGYGYMTEYPVARAYQDVRVLRIFGGTNEIMKQIIGQDVVGRR